MPGVRSYDDPCGVARALDLVGDRWALLVVRELLLGPKRFAELSRGLPGMSQNVLSQRLRELEASGLASRRKLGPPASAHVYELTERGYALEPVLLALGHWGSRAPLASTAELSGDALVLALKTTFDRRTAADLDARFELWIGDDRFWAEVVGGQFHIARGAADRPDATLTGDSATIRSVVFGGRPIDDAVRAGVLQVEGRREPAEHFVHCFPRPTGAA